MFGSSVEPPAPRRSGLSLWFAAAAALVVGILIGFASGYRAGQTETDSSATAAPEQPAPTAGTPTPGQTFSESPVNEPARIDPEPIVPTQETKPAPAPPQPAPQAAKRPPPKPAAAPAPAADRGARTPQTSAPPRPAAAVPKPVQAPASGPGAIQVVSRPAGAEVVLDGRVIGRTPLSIGEVAAGTHTIRLELPGFQRWETTVDLKPGSSQRVAASLEQ